jgi:hypothetical protein
VASFIADIDSRGGIGGTSNFNLAEQEYSQAFGDGNLGLAN